MHDIAQIKSLLPTLIKFAYIDRDMLQVHASGEADSEKARKRQERDELFVLQPAESPASEANDLPRAGPSNPREPDDQVLVFEFNDGELKGKGGKVIHKRFA